MCGKLNKLKERDSICVSPLRVSLQGIIGCFLVPLDPGGTLLLLLLYFISIYKTLLLAVTVLIFNGLRLVAAA